MVLLSGVPASGKSYFGSWLEDHKSFLHIDAEKDGRLLEQGLLPLWDSCFQGGNPAALVNALQALNRPVAFNWGFPTCWLPVVEAMKREGFDIWWFDADRNAARRAFARRGDVPLHAFDKQIADIARDWSKIKKVFSPNIMRTLKSNGAYTEPAEIYRKIFGSTNM